MIARIGTWGRAAIAQYLRDMGATVRISGTPLREVGMGSTVIGGAQAIRSAPGRKWHRLVDRATAEAYARSHGRKRKESGGWASRDLVVLCGQPIPARMDAEARVFEDRPDTDACAKCWDA